MFNIIDKNKSMESPPTLPPIFLDPSWILPRLFLDSSSTLPRLFLDSSSTLPRLFLDSSSTFPRLFLDFSSTFPRLFLGFSSTFPRLFLGFSSAFPRLFLGFSSTFPRLFLDCSSAFPRRCLDSASTGNFLLWVEHWDSSSIPFVHLWGPKSNAFFWCFSGPKNERKRHPQSNRKFANLNCYSPVPSVYHCLSGISCCETTKFHLPWFLEMT